MQVHAGVYNSNATMFQLGDASRCVRVCVCVCGVCVCVCACVCVCVHMWERVKARERSPNAVYKVSPRLGEFEAQQ